MIQTICVHIEKEHTLLIKFGTDLFQFSSQAEVFLEDWMVSNLISCDGDLRTRNQIRMLIL